MEERLLVSINEAWSQLGVSRSKLFELVAAGEVEVVKIGRRTLVPQESLRDYVDRLRALSRAMSSPVEHVTTATAGGRGRKSL